MARPKTRDQILALPPGQVHTAKEISMMIDREVSTVRHVLNALRKETPPKVRRFLDYFEFPTNYRNTNREFKRMTADGWMILEPEKESDA